MSNTGILLCGTSINWQSNFLADIVSISGLGGTRRAIDNAKNSDAGGFAGVILSCIARGKPFRCTIVFSPKLNWMNALLASLGNWTITWPPEYGYTNSDVWQWKVGMTDYTVTGQLEDRMMAEVELTPSGAPTITAATT